MSRKGVQVAVGLLISVHYFPLWLLPIVSSWSWSSLNWIGILLYITSLAMVPMGIGLFFKGIDEKHKGAIAISLISVIGLVFISALLCLLAFSSTLQGMLPAEDVFRILLITHVIFTAAMYLPFLIIFIKLFKD